MPGELLTAAVDYVYPSSVKVFPTFLFVVDICLYEEEMEALKDSLQQAISLLPSESGIALITYGSTVHIHELGFQPCVKSYVFKGTSEITQADVTRQLRITKINNIKQKGIRFAVARV